MGRRPMSPCYKCDEKYLGCHSKCEKYIEFSNKSKERNAMIRVSKEVNAQLMSHTVAMREKARRSHGGSRR